MAFGGHAHVHDEYSPLDGAANRNQLSYEAVRKGQWFMGITNHGRLGGALEHVDACRHPENYDNPVDLGKKRTKDERLLPILGIEAYWRPDRFMDLSDKTLYGKLGHNWAQHLCLHARTLNGWRTLMRLSSKSWVKRERGGGHYGRPCVDWDMLQDDHEDIIVSTACVNSPVSHMILAGDESGARKWCVDMMKIVGEDNLFFELMPHDLDIQREVNIGKINIAGTLGRPCMVTGDVHVPYENWKDTYKIVMMAATRQSFSKREKKVEAGEEVYGEEVDTVYLSGEKELLAMFKQNHPSLPKTVVQEALANTEIFAKRFKPIVFGHSPKMPKAGTPQQIEKTIKGWLAEGKAKREEDWLNDGVSKAEFRRRHKIYYDRIDYEWDVIKAKNQLDYFYLVGDAVRWARSDKPLPALKDEDDEDYYPEHQEAGFTKRPIRVTCRGSAAGCLVSYDIRITNVDPIPHGMLFERFMNPDRIGMPDIDIDVESGHNGRDLFKEYIRRTQGKDHVADIIAYQTFAPRAVLKAIGDVFDVPFPETKRVNDSIGDTERGIQKIAKDNEVVAKHLQKYPDVAKHCLRLEDQIMRDTKHAAGMLITPKRTSYYVPTQLGADDVSTVTAWADRADFPVLSDNGLIKLDVLGVTALQKQQIAVELIADYYGEEFEPDDLPAQRDPYAVEQTVLDMFVQGLTIGVFQFGGRGITQLLRHIKPTSIVDLTIANALYRPGPIKFAFEYGDRKNGNKPVTYLHEAVEPVLQETLGIICFQEQIMEICKQVGNFTGGQADSMRKAVSKLYRIPGDKAQEYMQGFYEPWMQGCRDNGLKDKDANSIWSWVLPFGDYAFNRTIKWDTTVERTTSNQYEPDPRITLQEIWERFYGDKASTAVGKKYRYSGFTIRGWDKDTGRIMKKRVIDIHDHGVQKLYNVTLANGLSISGSAAHRHMTPDGWRTVRQLQVGDELLFDTEVQDATKESGLNQAWQRGATKEWIRTATLRQVANDGRRRPILHGHHSSLALVTKELPDYCEFCGTDKGRLERAHLDGDRTNNSRENVKRLCNHCHKTLDGHRRGGPWSRGSISNAARIVAIQFDGWHQTYDLEVEGETDMDHNFLANGIVTHNSHAGTYSLQAHQDMVIKHHWPRAFYAALLTVEKKDNRAKQHDFLKSVLREARIFDIDTTRPDINRSQAGWTIDKDKLRYGLVSIIGVGGAAAKEVVDKRPYRDFDEFIHNMDSGFGVDNIVALAKAGSFDELAERNHILSRVRQWPETTARFNVVMSCKCKKMKTVKVDEVKKLDKEVRLAMIELECKKHSGASAAEWEEIDPYYTMAQWYKDNRDKLDLDPPVGIAPNDDELLAMEIDVLHLPMSTGATTLKHHDFIESRVFTQDEIDAAPAKPERKGKKHRALCSCEDCTASEVVVGGEVVNIKVIKTKRTEELMAFVDFAFGVSNYSVTLFPWAYERFANLLQRPTAFLVAGHKDNRNSIMAYEISDVVDVVNELEEVTV